MIRKTHKQSYEERKEIADFVKANPDLRQIDVAKIFNCSQTKVVNASVEHFIFRKKGYKKSLGGKFGNFSRAVVVSTIKEHPDWTGARLAAHLGTTYWKVRHQIEKHGLPHPKRGMPVGGKGRPMPSHTKERLREGYNAWIKKRKETLQ